ncbi:MAG: hypothetical protein GXP08_06185 [Gammaproteobacteria bacterium]|nr:hypothetical protein [Gammaproteobacteria bacterium]
MTLKSFFTCKDTHEQLDAYLDSDLTATESCGIKQHLQHCNTCNALFTQRQQLVHAMNTMPDISTPTYLSRRILETRAAKQRQKVIWFSAGIASTLAASILVFVVTLILKPVDSSIQTMNAVVASLHEIQNINVVVHSDRVLENVRFSVVMPSNIQLKGYSGLHELAWNGKLTKGDNLLSLPVIARDATPGILVMRVQHQGAEKEYRINVDIDRRGHLS